MLTSVALQTMTKVLVAVIALTVLVVLAVIIPNLKLYVQAKFSGAKVGMMHLIGMRLRKTDARMIVFAYIRSTHAGLGIPIDKVERHHLSGGRVGAVVNAMIAADRAGLPLTWEEACAIDLSGRDVQAEISDLVRSLPSVPASQ